MKRNIALPTRQNHNVLIIHNSDFGRQAAKVCFAGRVELTTQEITAFLKWLRSGPVSDHAIISFGDDTTGSNTTTGNRVAFGEVDNHVAREDALALVNQTMVLSADKGLPALAPAKQQGGSYVGQN